jgi:predicted amidophosphoribosyltransferase
MLGEGLLCDECRNNPPQFERAVSSSVYQDELREMIHLLKYERLSGVADALGDLLAASILSLQADAARELIVVAVPLFPAKQRQRGYNQSALLATAAISCWSGVAIQPASLNSPRTGASEICKAHFGRMRRRLLRAARCC